MTVLAWVLGAVGTTVFAAGFGRFVAQNARLSHRTRPFVARAAPRLLTVRPIGSWTTELTIDNGDRVFRVTVASCPLVDWVPIDAWAEASIGPGGGKP